MMGVLANLRTPSFLTDALENPESVHGRVSVLERLGSLLLT